MKIRLFVHSAVCCMSGLAFAQTGSVTTTSAANYRPIVAPGSIASGWGSGLTPTTVLANTNPVGGQPIQLPTTLGPTTLSIRDSGGTTATPSLYMVSPGQINFVVPSAAKLGQATLTVDSASRQSGPVLVSTVSPALFTFDGSGAGVPVGTVLRLTASNVSSTDNLYDSGSSFPPKPINLTTATDRVYLTIYGTGFRGHSLNPVQATIGGVKVPVLYADAQTQYPGFDQVNLGPLPQTLVGKGSTDLIVTVDGVPSNTVRVAIR